LFLRRQGELCRRSRAPKPAPLLPLYRRPAARTKISTLTARSAAESSQYCCSPVLVLRWRRCRVSLRACVHGARSSRGHRTLSPKRRPQHAARSSAAPLPTLKQHTHTHLLMVGHGAEVGGVGKAGRHGAVHLVLGCLVWGVRESGCAWCGRGRHSLAALRFFDLPHRSQHNLPPSILSHLHGASKQFSCDQAFVHLCAEG
jgi:hypothetical protein